MLISILILLVSVFLGVGLTRFIFNRTFAGPAAVNDVYVGSIVFFSITFWLLLGLALHSTTGI